MLATEIEFYLTDEDGKPVYDGIQCYSLQKGAELEHVVGRRAPRDRGLRHRRRGLQHRVRPGAGRDQLRPRRSRSTACDDTVVFKSVVREIARNHGLRATFMAKPFPGVSGNGLHLHHSLRKDGVNVFEHATDELPLGNASMRHWVAGLTTHAAQIALLANPTVNAYKRIEDYSFAPTRVSWGLDNRNVAVRCIPQVGRGLARRVPRRRRRRQSLPARGRACWRPAWTAIERELELPPAAEHDAYADERLPLLPRTLGAAIEAWEATPFARETFGERFADNYAGLARYDLRSTRPPSPTGRRSATGSSHSLGGDAHARMTDNDC